MRETSFEIMLIIFNLIFIAFIGAIVIFIREYRKKKKAHLKQLENVDTLHKEELLKTQIEIQTQTMKHIGREIHDNVGQKLTLSSLYLQQLPLDKQSTEIKNSLINIGNIIDESIEDLRHLSKSLTDDAIKSNTIFELINNECERIKTLKEYQITFNSNLKNKSIPYKTKSVLLRITQEVLQNSIKHSHCKKIEISLFENQSQLLLNLKDDGKGFDVKGKYVNGIGLKNIQRRVEIINGFFELKSNHSTGTEYIIKVPI